MTKKKAKTKLTGDELRGQSVDFWRTHNADETLRRQTLEQPKKSHAQIKREVDEILAGKHDGTSGRGGRDRVEGMSGLQVGDVVVRGDIRGRKRYRISHFDSSGWIYARPVGGGEIVTFLPEHRLKRVQEGAGTEGGRASSRRATRASSAFEASRGAKSAREIEQDVERIANPGVSLPESLRFRVDVQNQPRRIFNSAEEALSHGMRRVYLHWSKTSEMLERLKRGEPAAWAYGFSSVEIAPL